MGRKIDRDLGALTPEELAMLERRCVRRGDRWTRPHDGELALVARRRSGLTLRDTANRLMGISHVSLIKRERGNGDQGALRRFWEGRGFVYPEEVR